MMIERVAKAIDMVPSDIDVMTQRRAEARAAIEAMREPTTKMVLAGCKAREEGVGVSMWLVDRIWQAMIDAVLKEQQEAKGESI